jgi:tetratricopeptide (TPR) repeat protein
MKASYWDGIKDSRQYFERVVYEDSSFVDSLYQIALYHLRCSDDSAEALKHPEKALELEPENREVLRLIRIYYLHHPKDYLAKLHLEKAKRCLPENDPRIPFYFGILYDPYWSSVKEVDRWVSKL